jgi:hypothetical protein
MWLLGFLVVIILVAIVQYGLRATDPVGTWSCNGGHPGAYVFAQMSVGPDRSATLLLRRMATIEKPGAGGFFRGVVHKVNGPAPVPQNPPISLTVDRTYLGLGLAFDQVGASGSTPYATGRVGLFHRTMRLHIINPNMDLALSEAQSPKPLLTPIKKKSGQPGQGNQNH